MLRIIRSKRELNFSLLADVYAQPDRTNPEQYLRDEQDLYAYISSFMEERQAFCAVWELSGRYVAALRMEPYKDGLLLEGLQTIPEERGKSYATALLHGVLTHLQGITVYSHVDLKNQASLAVHRTCGFEKTLDYAVFIDGSVSHKAVTLCYKT